MTYSLSVKFESRPVLNKFISKPWLFGRLWCTAAAAATVGRPLYDAS